ncbi:hypothetical protein BKH42_03640 [Helicobacter sp. 13S00482-2]|uniref:AAA family ATPase n=1 Tax=Helicobacter sp. 13S00482-2 TaxID=1476200 RepID=UPI000BA6F296|nr:MoxR family ATPase [Helicobacter sp. 13S00482-2]PAF53834.1 hypothetical protein BKH42_03640 [Helicobacter sp. 13S00482-2]
MYKEKIIRLISELETKLIEREEFIRLSILCIFSRQHLFFIGAPGVAKTYAVEIMSKIFTDSVFWQKTLSAKTEESDFLGNKKDTPKEETILGANFLFFDEMFKAPDDTLVALLSVLNERYYTIGGKPYPIPLYTLFSASNEIPATEKIEPFTDRLLIWYRVEEILKSENRNRFYRNEFGGNKNFLNTFSLKDIDEVCQKAERVKLNNEILEIYEKIRINLKTSFLGVSDRKMGPKYILQALKVSAVLNDRDAVNHSDLLLMRHMLWTDDKKRNRVFEIVEKTILGDKVNIQTRIGVIKKKFEDFNNDFDRSNFKFLNHQLFITKSEVFNQSIQNCYEFERLLTQLEEESKIIEDFYKKTIQIQKEIEDNILCWKNRHFAFTQETLDLFYNCSSMIRVKLKALKTFIEQNNDLYSYQKNQYKKGVRHV